MDFLLQGGLVIRLRFSFYNYGDVVNNYPAYVYEKLRSVMPVSMYD